MMSEYETKNQRPIQEVVESHPLMFVAVSLFSFPDYRAFPMEWCTFGRFCDAFLPLYRWGFCCTCPQGGYWHGTASLTFGVDIESIRWLGILQRIAVGYFVAALCEIWLPCQKWRAIDFYKSCYWQWCIAFSMSAMGLLYGVYVPDWQLRISDTTSSYLSSNDSNVYTVKCAVRGDIGPACNSAGMIDRYILGVHHLYTKPVYRNLKECNASKSEGDPGSSPSWRHDPFDPKVY